MKQVCNFITIFIGLQLYSQTPFVNITKQAGIEHQFIVYEGMFGGGVCAFDVNNDGYDDLYITGGNSNDMLYLNQRDGTFKNILEGSGLEVTKHFVTQGVISADINKDHLTDLYITTITSRDSIQIVPRAMNLLFLNLGNNKFRDVTKEYRLDKFISFSAGANFGDVNCDGYPDLYVGNYFQDFQGQLKEINDATIVNANRTAYGYLLINHKGKYFTNEYTRYGLSHKGFGFGGVFTDYDNDNDQDLFVNQDFGYKAIPDFLFNNQYPIRKFKDVSDSTNMDLKINSMGAAVGDYDNDGDMDYYITNIRFNYFMINNGVLKPFQNRAGELGMHYLTISWGANFADFDHDGDIDLFVSNGDLNPNCVPMADFYFKNENYTFVESARAVGLADYGIGRGSATFDLENDGDLDVIVVNQKPIYDYPVSSFTNLYRNDSASGNWLKLKLKGNTSESRGLGSRIELYYAGKKLIREVDGGGSSHISQNSSVVHFGIDSSVYVDSIVVKWSGKNPQYLGKTTSNQIIEIEQLESESKSVPGTLVLGGFIAILSALGFSIWKRNTKNKKAL